MIKFNQSKKGFVRPAIAVSTAVFLMLTFWMAVSASTPLGSAGYLDFSYLGFNGSTSPTGEKPESKLWWNDGFWWGSMFNNTTARYEIYRLNWGSQTWETTGVALDDRTNSKADTLFVDDPVNPKLFVASHVFAQTGNYITGSSTNRARLYRYSYSRATQSYTLDAGFPVNIADDRLEALTLARDPASGRLWIAYISQEHVATPTKHQLFVNASTDNTGLTWGTSVVPTLPFSQTVADTVKAGDMSSLVVANGKVVVVWNNASSPATQKTLYVAYRAAGLSPSNAKTGWSLAQIPVPEGTDDHINLKSLQATASGQIFAAVKTSASQALATPPMNHVNMIGIDINAVPVYSRTFPYSDNHAKDSRPIVVLDEGDPANANDGNVYLFVTSSDSSGYICYGSLPLKPTIAAMSNFPKGINCGTPFIQDSPTRYGGINNATSMKRSANNSTGIVVLASDDITPVTVTTPVRVYVHNVMGNPPPVLTARGPFNLVGTVFNAGNISPTATITGTFSKLMNPNTINTTNFTVKDSSSTVAGVISYDVNSRTATFTPKSLLKANTVYTAEMSSAIVDNTNLPLGGTFRTPGPPERWRFTTGPATINFVQASYSAFENAGTVAVSVALDTASTLPVTIHYATSDGTATSADYTAKNGTLTFNAGERTKPIIVTLANDAVAEGNETVNLTLDTPNAQGRLGLQSTAQLIIIDDDSTSVQFIPTSLSVGESAGQAVFQVALSRPSALPVSVSYVITGGTATANEDYVLAAGTLDFAANEMTRPITVTIKHDTLHELDETIILQLLNPTNAVLGIPGNVATLTIQDDDLQPGIKFEQAEYPVGEGDGSVKLKVGLTASSAVTVTVNYATSDISATAPSDYVEKSGTLIFAPLETSKEIDVPIVDDGFNESDADFNVALSDPTNAPLAVPFNAHVTIQDNDPLPVVSFKTTELSGNEAAGSVLVEVDLDTASRRAVTVEYVTSDGTATAESDYSTVQSTLTFAPGETSQFFEIPLLDDSLGEGSETVNLQLNNPNGAVLDANKGAATLTLIDNDAAPVVGFSQTSYSVKENGTSAVVTVTLNATSSNDVTVDYATSNGTATAGSDYTATSGKLTIPAGQIRATFAVPITNDTQSEAPETINLTLSNANGAAPGTVAATLTISDDDPAAVLFSKPNYTVNENGGTAVVTVTLTAPLASPVTVNYATSDGTATGGSDYTASTGSLTFNAGEMNKTISIPISDDTKSEGSETVNLALSSPTSGVILGAQATATLTIIDNDTKSLVFLPVVRK